MTNIYQVRIETGKVIGIFSSKQRAFAEALQYIKHSAGDNYEISNASGKPRNERHLPSSQRSVGHGFISKSGESSALVKIFKLNERV